MDAWYDFLYRSLIPVDLLDAPFYVIHRWAVSESTPSRRNVGPRGKRKPQVRNTAASARKRAGKRTAPFDLRARE